MVCSPITQEIDNNAGERADLQWGHAHIGFKRIVGGTLSAQAGSFISGSDGTLNGVTNTGTTTIASGSIRLLNNITNQGKFTFSGSNINDEILNITGAVTLSGSGEVQLVNSHSKINNFGGTLTNVDNLIHGGNGGSIGKQMINSGTVRADNGVLTVTQQIDNTSGSVQTFTGATLALSSTSHWRHPGRSGRQFY